MQKIIGSTYLMLNLRTKRVLLSCGIIWIKKNDTIMYQDANIQMQMIVFSNTHMSPINRLNKVFPVEG